MTSQLRKGYREKISTQKKANKSGIPADKIAHKTKRNLLVKTNKEAKKSFS